MPTPKNHSYEMHKSLTPAVRDRLVGINEAPRFLTCSWFLMVFCMVPFIPFYAKTKDGAWPDRVLRWLEYRDWHRIEGYCWCVFAIALVIGIEVLGIQAWVAEQGVR